MRTKKSRRLARNKRTRKYGGNLHGCISDGASPYAIGEMVGFGEEGVVYLDSAEPSKVIKQFYEIIRLKDKPFNTIQLVNYMRIFKISKKLGVLGHGPKVYFDGICKTDITKNIDELTPIELQRLSAKFPFGSRELNQLRGLKARLTQPPNSADHLPPAPGQQSSTNDNGLSFDYTAFIPYLVMDKIDGCEITDDDINNSVIMNKVYNKYTEILKAGYTISDLHKGNIMIKKYYDKIESVMFIDFSSAKETESVDPEILALYTYTNADELKSRLLNPTRGYEF